MIILLCGFPSPVTAYDNSLALKAMHLAARAWSAPGNAMLRVLEKRKRPRQKPGPFLLSYTS